MKRVGTLACVVALMLFNAPAVRSGWAQSGKIDVQSDLDALIAAAKAEGEVVLYSAPTDPIARRLMNAFTAKYGIKGAFLRIASATLTQRYATEAAAGSIAADVVINAGDVFVAAQQGIQKGWVQSIDDAKLPVVRSGQFPAKFNRGATALVQILPTYVVYNTEKLKGDAIPKDWPDLLKPEFKGEIIISSPLSADFNLEIYVKLRDKYGEDFLRKLTAQQPRLYEGGVQAIQALAAGEGKVMFPISYPSVHALIEKGAPVAGLLFDYTTGAEMQVMLTHPSMAKHPNAGRLFANFVMSEEGNAVLNADPGGFTIYQDTKLPKDFRAPSMDSPKYKDEIAKMLGFK